MTGMRYSNPANRERAKADEVIASAEPVIEWVKNRRGIWVAAWVNDPHPDGGHNGEKTACKRNHPFTEANTMITSSGHRQCRACKNEPRRVA